MLIIIIFPLAVVAIVQHRDLLLFCGRCTYILFVHKCLYLRPSVCIRNLCKLSRTANGWLILFLPKLSSGPGMTLSSFTSALYLYPDKLLTDPFDESIVWLAKVLCSSRVIWFLTIRENSLNTIIYLNSKYV